MKHDNSRQSKTFAILALFASFVPVTIMTLWIKAASLGDTQEERVAIFYTYLPEFLRGRWNSTYLSIVFCIMAIVLSVKSMKSSSGLWRAFNILILTVSGGLLCLNLFSML